MDALSPKEFAIVNELASLLRKNGRNKFHGNCSILHFFFYCCDFYLLILIFFAMHVLISVSFFSLENDRLLCRRTDPQWKYSVLFDDTITKSVEPCLPTVQRDQI